MKRFFKNKKQKGFTLLIAALVASIAVALGSSIYTIVSKELVLSSIGQDSQFAFYAADTAAECALYWDARSDVHPNTFATSSTDATASPSSVTCDGVAASSIQTTPNPNGNAATTTLRIDSLFKDVSRGGYCADIAVGKSFNAVSDTEKTLVIANGYSVACSAIPTAPDVLQRTVELQY